MPMPAHYDPVPRSSSELDGELAFKPPRPRSLPSIVALLRKARRVFRPVYILVALVALLVVQLLCNASYNSPPPFNLSPDETVFIAANIIDGALINGPWGQSLLELVDLIGWDRVYVSIYGGPTAALKDLEAKLQCEKSIVSEENEPIDLDAIQHTALHTGESRIKRIAYLAEVRNRALKPLDTLTRRYDRVLFLNDVFFEARDAARLLWGTNINEETGKADYKAVCGADFVTSWKYYDTFATRDYEGFSMGVPIYPWFSNEGQAQSRRDVLDERSAVRVKSCWGGIVAFDGRYFQREARPETSPTPKANDAGKRAEAEPAKTEAKPATQLTSPIRFRAETEAFWESSECCLIHADLLARSSPTEPSADVPDSNFAHHPAWGVGIYMNPYVRVSYDAGTHSRLWLARRFERLFILPQRLANALAHMPHFNPRRAEAEGQRVPDREWVANAEEGRLLRPREGDAGVESPAWVGAGAAVERRGQVVGSSRSKAFWEQEGHYVEFERTAGRGGYCGVRQLTVLKEGVWGEDGGGNWVNVAGLVPPL